MVLNARTKHWKDWQYYVDKFKIISELVKGDILLANYILNKILYKKLNKTLYEFWNDQSLSYKSVGVSRKNYDFSTKKSQNIDCIIWDIQAILEGYSNTNRIIDIKDSKSIKWVYLYYWRSYDLLKIF
jgi:hypothetical protein